MTLLPYLLPSYGEATTLSGLMALSNSLYIAVKMRKQIDWRALAPILITFIAVSMPTVILIKHIDEHWMRRVLGVMLIFISLVISLHIRSISASTTRVLTI